MPPYVAFISFSDIGNSVVTDFSGFGVNAIMGVTDSNNDILITPDDLSIQVPVQFADATAGDAMVTIRSRVEAVALSAIEASANCPNAAAGNVSFVWIS